MADHAPPDRNSVLARIRPRRLRLAPAAALLVVGPWMFTACSSDDPSPVCEARSQLDSAMSDLRDLKISDDGIAAFQAGLVEVSDRLTDLRSAAAAEIAPTIGEVESSIAGLRTAIDSAATPVAKLEAAKSGLGEVGTGVQQLKDQLSDECK